MVKFPKSFIINFFLIFLIFSSIITLTNEKNYLKKRKSLRKLETTIITSIVNVATSTPKVTSVTTSTPTVTSVTTSTPTVTVTTVPTVPDTTSTDSTNSTNSTVYTSSSNGLSTGAIVGILIPSILAVGGVGAFAFLSRGARPPIQYGNNVNTTNNKLNLQNESRQNIREVQINQPEIIQQNPAIPIGNQVPGAINQSIPNHQVVVSQNQLVPNNNVINAVQAF